MIKKLLLAILGLGFALAFTSTWKSSSKRPTSSVDDESPHYALVEKIEKERHHYSRKW
jgi:hypothetical protein